MKAIMAWLKSLSNGETSLYLAIIPAIVLWGISTIWSNKFPFHIQSYPDSYLKMTLIALCIVAVLLIYALAIISFIKQQPEQNQEQTKPVTLLNDPSKPYDIFISYRSSQFDWVEVLAKNLQAQGYNVFLDRWSIRGGEHFKDAIYQAIKTSRYGLLIATPDSSESGWVQDEYKLMQAQQRQNPDFRLIPVVLGEFPDLPFLEEIQAIDFKDSSRENYAIAFQRLLCSLEDTPPCADTPFAGELEIPLFKREEDRDLLQSESHFIDDIFDSLDNSNPVMVLSQADSSTQHYLKALYLEAQSRYGEDCCLRLFPPNSGEVNKAAYFSRLAKQGGFDSSITSSWQWADALAERLAQDKVIFVLISGFENGSDDARKELAGELRNLIGNYPDLLKLVIFGSQKLAAMRYENGSLSLLNQLEDKRIPELNKADLNTVFGQRYAGIKNKNIDGLLEFTGQHPRLLHACLQANIYTAEACEAYLQDSPLPSQLFTQFYDDSKILCQYLQQRDIGNYSAWPQDTLIRRLYWSNLIKREGSRFIWRSDFIQKVGQESLACNEVSRRWVSEA